MRPKSNASYVRTRTGAHTHVRTRAQERETASISSSLQEQQQARVRACVRACHQLVVAKAAGGTAACSHVCHAHLHAHRCWRARAASSRKSARLLRWRAVLRPRHARMHPRACTHTPTRGGAHLHTLRWMAGGRDGERCIGGNGRDQCRDREGAAACQAAARRSAINGIAPPRPRGPSAAQAPQPLAPPRPRSL